MSGKKKFRISNRALQQMVKDGLGTEVAARLVEQGIAAPETQDERIEQFTDRVKYAYEAAVKVLANLNATAAEEASPWRFRVGIFEPGKRAARKAKVVKVRKRRAASTTA